MMGVEQAIHVQGCHLTVLAERRDRPFGHAIDVTIIDAENRIRGKAAFGCHPEFRCFDECQAMSTDALIDVVRQRLTVADITDCCEAFDRGITLLFRFNAPDDPWRPVVPGVAA